MTEKTYVKRLEGNVKGANAYELGPCTLVVGSNRAGKSAIVDELSLATTGEARSTGIGKRGIDMMALCEPEKELRALAELSDGTTAKLTCKGTTAKASKPDWSGAEVTFIADEAEALLRGDAKKLRQALVERLGLSILTGDLKSRIPPAYWSTWTKAAGLPEGSEPMTWDATMILETVEKIDSERRRVSKDLKVVEGLRFERIDPLSAEEVAELNQLIEQSAQVGLTEGQIEEMRVVKGRVEEELGLLRAEHAQAPPPPSSDESIDAMLRKVGEVQQWLRMVMLQKGQQSASCPTCGRPGVTVLMIEDHAEKLKTAMESISSSRLAHASWHEREARIKSLEKQSADLGRKLASATLAAPVDQQRLSTLRERQTKVDSLAGAETRHGELIKLAADLKALKSIADTLVADILDSKLTDLERRIQAALPEGTTPVVSLREGNREICRVSMRVGDDPPRDFRALSGAERTILLAAFSSAIANGAEGAKLLVIDDIWFDQTSLEGLLASLRNTVDQDTGPTQVVLCAVEYRGKDPEGWTIIRLDDSKEAS